MARRWMRRLLKIAVYGVAALVVLVAGAITLTVGWRPLTGPKARAVQSERRFEATPARLERGQYLVESTVGCFECHTTFDNKAEGLRVMVSAKGAGRTFADEGGFRLVAPNITPDAETGIGRWSDDELARAIREGIGRDGHALFPMMPYKEHRHISDEDLASIIVYLRTVAPVRSEMPKMQLPFPLSRIVNIFPDPVTTPVAQPDLSTPVKRGEYMVHLGGCTDCHTPSSSMPPFGAREGMMFAGGNKFGEVVSANLTPDPSGISYYDEALFVEAIRTGHVKARKLSTEMPWQLYRNMSDEDLKSIFAYLRTLKPVDHTVDNTVPAPVDAKGTPIVCKKCGIAHGGADRNGVDVASN